MINQESIAAADRWLATIVGAFFPGLVLLDLIFGKGLFSSSPGSIYEFTLLLTYAAAISFIYGYLAQAAMISFIESRHVDDLSADKVGMMTIPLVAFLTVTTVVIFFAIEAVANLNFYPFHYKHARFVNALVALTLTVALSNICSAHYFSWYKKRFS